MSFPRVVGLGRAESAHTARVRAALSPAADVSLEWSSDIDAGILAAIDARVVVVAGEATDECLRILSRLRRSGAAAPAIAIPLTASSQELLALLRGGFVHALTSPLRSVDVLPHVWRHLDVSDTDRALHTRVAQSKLVGISPAFERTMERVRRVSVSSSTVLITGETGTGKELCARAIHYLGPRSGRAFVPVNCGAIPDELAENELFGHARGAYTHAVGAQDGLVQTADGGTLFLDEVDSLSPAVQAKLLRFLQTGEYRQVGSPHLHMADVRIVSATNADPSVAIASGRLRQDLYYRLCTLSVQVPPLRERREDVSLLADYFLGRHRGTHSTPLRLSADAYRALEHHTWPGNVRELEQVIERACTWTRGEFLTPETLELPAAPAAEPSTFRTAKRRAVSDFERGYIEGLLRRTRGNITRAAELAGQNRRALFELIRKHSIDVERFRA